MPTQVIQAIPRQTATKHALRTGRKQGQVPGVLYGHTTPNQPIWVQQSELQEVLRRSSQSELLQIALPDGPPAAVLIKEVQYQPLERIPRHIDLQVVRMDEQVQVAIPIQLHGDAPGVKAGGILQPGVREIKVRALPQDLLPSIMVEIGDLDFGRPITVADLELPAEWELITEPSQVVAGITAQNTKAADQPEAAPEPVVAAAATEKLPATAEEAEQPSPQS